MPGFDAPPGDFTETTEPAAAFPQIYSSILSATTGVTISQSATDYPILTITGPGICPKISNLTTGAYFELSYTLAAGEVITVDCDPGEQSVVNQDSQDLSSHKTAASTYWGLQQGLNSLSFRMAGTSSLSSIAITY